MRPPNIDIHHEIVLAIYTTRVNLEIMHGDSLSTHDLARKPLIFSGSLERMATKPVDFGHNLQPYIGEEFA